MSSSKIKLKVQHNKHQQQTKQKKAESIEKSKQQKSGAKLGKSKSKEKQPKKPITEESDEQQNTKLNKSKSKDKKKDKKEDKQKEKSPNKKDKKQDKKNKKQDKKQDKKDKKSDKKDKKDSKAKDKNSKEDKKDINKKGKKDKKGKKGKNDQSDEDEKSLKKSKSKNKLDKQLQTINNINKETTKAKLTIGQLIELYKDASYDIFINHGHNPEKEKEIQQELLRLQKQKQKRRKKIEELQKEAEEKKKQKQQGIQQKLRLKKERIIQKRKRNISLRLQNIAEQAKKRDQEHDKFKQYCTQRKKHIPRYQKYEEQFKDFEQCLKQEQEEILQQRKLKVAPIDYEELEKFQESYQEQKIEALQHSQRKLELQQQIISQQNQWMKNVYKGSAYRAVKEQATRNPLIAQHQTAKEKLQKTKEYAELVKSQFVEKDEENENEPSRIVYDSQDVRYREKHVMGKSLGLIPEKRVKPLSHDEKVKMGVSYLQHLRKLPRKGINSSSLPKTIDTPQRIGKTYILKKPTDPYYNVQKNSASFDAKNPRQIQLAIEQVKSKDHSTALQQKSLHYLQYSGVMDLQKRHLDVNKRLIGDINSKLDILKKLVD